MSKGKNMKTLQMILTLWALFFVSLSAEAKKKVREVQEVNFSEMSLKGTIRNPDGAYLVQKKGIRFLPLYEVQKDFDSKIRQSSEVIK